VEQLLPINRADGRQRRVPQADRPANSLIRGVGFMADFRFHFFRDFTLRENGNENGTTLVFTAFLL
jgi:hypothetical protein